MAVLPPFYYSLPSLAKGHRKPILPEGFFIPEWIDEGD